MKSIYKIEGANEHRSLSQMIVCSLTEPSTMDKMAE